MDVRHSLTSQPVQALDAGEGQREERHNDEKAQNVAHDSVLSNLPQRTVYHLAHKDFVKVGPAAARRTKQLTSSNRTGILFALAALDETAMSYLTQMIVNKRWESSLAF